MHCSHSNLDSLSSNVSLKLLKWYRSLCKLRVEGLSRLTVVKNKDLVLVDYANSGLHSLSWFSRSAFSGTSIFLIWSTWSTFNCPNKVLHNVSVPSISCFNIGWSRLLWYFDTVYTVSTHWRMRYFTVSNDASNYAAFF